MKTHIIACLLVLFTQLLAHSQELKKSVGTVETAIYRLQQGDNIAMTIYQESDMSRSAMIGKSGSISYPLIGNVHVKGLTIPELEEKLRQLYQKDYYVDPKVSVIISSYTKLTVTVSGAVENPGAVAYPEEGALTLAQAVAAAGGIDFDGNTKRITVARKKGGSAVYSLVGGQGVKLSPGDTVVIPRLPKENALGITATISGEVNRPGNIALPRSGKLDILTALTLAGGYSRIANQKEAILQRKTGGSYRIETVKLKDIRNGKVNMVYIKEGDILIIKESRF